MVTPYAVHVQRKVIFQEKSYFSTWILSSQITSIGVVHFKWDLSGERVKSLKYVISTSHNKI